ncbi:MAG: alpha-L-rhamnosidase C-terminal domain-containing protein [Kiritimatiellia bacterium]
MEAPGEARSDCHAWGSHPIYFMHTGLAGITPAAPGFSAVRIAPCPGSLRRISSRTPHPDGFIETDFEFDGNGGISGKVTLPPGLSGEFVWHGRSAPLKAGRQDISSHGLNSRKKNYSRH